MDTDNEQAQSAIPSDALERLRDRTDELELIISSLTIFALFSLPGWVFDNYSGFYTHLSTAFAVAGTIGIAMVAGVCYGLAACFVVHLMARAYWVGLIGLRTVFPDGINWSRTPGIGPLTRERYREYLPNLDTVIRRTDRLASSLFAVISLLTLTVLWFGTIMLLTMVVAANIGGRFGLTNAGMGVGALLLVVVFMGLPALLWFADAVLAARIPRLQESRGFLGFVRLLGWATGIVYPRRLILPVQLTLQSNTRPVIFYIALMTAIAAIVVLGNTRMVGWVNFTVSSEFTYLTTTDVANGFRSTYYEDMASPKDRIRAHPRIDSFTQTGSFVRLFLPYQPLRDNLVLDQLCNLTVDEENVECLRKLWAVSIDDQSVSMEGFQTAERMDIGMRGLIGLVPMAGLEPGLRNISVEWNPNPINQDTPIDDRYTQINRTFTIPIAFAPDYELQLD